MFARIHECLRSRSCECLREFTSVDESLNSCYDLNTNSVALFSITSRPRRLNSQFSISNCHSCLKSFVDSCTI